MRPEQPKSHLGVEVNVDGGYRQDALGSCLLVGLQVRRLPVIKSEEECDYFLIVKDDTKETVGRRR